MNMKKLLTVAVAGLVLAGLAGCGSKESGSKDSVDLEGKTLVVTTAAPYEPYETMTEDGKLVGFDIDLGNALAEKMGFTIEWQNLEFDAALLAVQSGQADMVMAGVSPTEERLKVLDFSEVYYQDEADTANTVITLKDKGYASIEDLKGKTVGVQNGTIQQEAVEGIAEEYGLTVETRKEYADIAQEILNGNIDFMVCEKAMAEGLKETYKQLDSFLLGVGEGSEGNAIGFKKGSEYKAAFDKAIQEMKDSGEMQKLIDKWFKAE